jgi:hypothetical protein
MLDSYSVSKDGIKGRLDSSVACLDFVHSPVHRDGLDWDLDLQIVACLS